MSDQNIVRLTAALADRYRIERELGRGGMATVYLAQDLKHGRHVAVKVLDPQIAATVGAERFLREIRITAALQHPHILTLIDSGEADSFVYYVMPFAEGESLRTRLTRAAGPLPVTEAVSVLRELMDALAHAHSQGLVHRDVKPENIMLTGRHALVLDFGVAKAVQTAREGVERPKNTEGTLTSVGTSLGTPAYMAPEQAAGDPDVDHRADIYSAGLVAYEMLCGSVPFTGRPHEVISAQVTATPQPLRERAPQIPVALAALVMKCIAKRPEDRPQTAEAVISALDALGAAAGVRSASLWGQLETRLGRGGARVAAAVVLVAVGIVAASTIRSRLEERWVRESAMPEMQRLLDAGRADSAFLFVERALPIAERDSVLERLVWRVAFEAPVQSDPAGATVSWSFIEGEREWRVLGTAPDTLRFPRATILVRFELAGHRTRTFLPGGGPTPRVIVLTPDSAPNAEMVPIHGGRTETIMPGLSDIEPLDLSDFLMDRHEVSNAEYKRFLDSGGYTSGEYWTEPILVGGRTVTFAEGVRRFVDRTGRPGPASWEGGTYPAGAAELPVGGVSWYEAAAYAKFAGKMLPTVHHWNRAAGTPAMSVIVTESNFASDGPHPAAAARAMSTYGTYDMAGNVREWIANSFGTQRFILGGGWTDQTYSFVDAYAQDPMDRNAINGIRLMKLAANDSTPRTAWAPIARQFRDYSRERPVSDEVYRGLAGTFAYDRVALDARVESVDSSAADWTVERVTIATPYGRERMPIYVHVPKRGRAPMQTVIYFPGSGAFYQTSSENVLRASSLDAIVNSGRIVVMPVYASMWEREHTLDSDAPRETALYRDHVAMWVKDVHRTLDYLETRPEVDTSKIGYFGYSFGGRMSPMMLATEPRLKVAVLAVAGLKMERPRPESDPLNYLPRVRIPVLMLNGEFDHYFPLETSQKPFLRMLGTPPDQKRHVVFRGGHTVPRTLLISESLAWYDRYLGPTAR